MRALERIRRAIREENYRISMHANEEIDAEGFAAADMESIILGGAISRIFTRDPRGVRFEIAGPATDGRAGYVVCRFLPSRVLLIITAYAAGNHGVTDHEED